MILHGIKAHNFMSLRDDTIDELDAITNVVVKMCSKKIWKPG
jgi:hypothetical protein